MEEQRIKQETFELLINIDFDSEINDEFGLPTQSLVQKYLRDKHNINILMAFKPNIKKWDFFPYNMNMNGIEYVKYNNIYNIYNLNRRYDTYEQALEDGLIESLNIIHNKLL